jgi:hypothetical protein
VSKKEEGSTSQPSHSPVAQQAFLFFVSLDVEPNKYALFLLIATFLGIYAISFH